MRRFIGVLLVILATYTTSFALDENSVAPEIKLPDLQDNTLSTTDLKGNIVYIDFWASWCGPCKKSMPWLNSLNEKYKDKKFKILAVNLDTNRGDAEKMISAENLKFTIIFDPQGLSPEKFEVDTMPSSFLIDSDGRIRKIFKGFDDDHKVEIENAIEELLKENL